MGVAHEGAIFAQIYRRLETEMVRIRDEIHRYPAPIPACDAQFNHLLESREALSSALARLRELMVDDAGNDAGALIEAFLDSSYDLGDSVKSAIRSIIENDARHAEGRQ
jgi:hypothetical protein